MTLLSLKYEVLPTAEEANDWPLTTIRSGSVKTGALKGDPIGERKCIIVQFRL